jgi:uncharacterized protein YjbI with pentapeptide repeats
MSDDEVRVDQQAQARASDSTARGVYESDEKTPSGPERTPADPQPGVAKKMTATDSPESANADPKKEALEIRKLSLEIQALTFKQSRWGRVVELLQGVVPVLAILSLVWTVFVGLDQQEAQRRDAESARFERAYAKLGSRLPSERATGVAQASSLLHLAGGARDKDVLTALANQLALDEDAAVRSAILNVFSNLDKATGQDALDAVLKSIVDLHRVIVQSSGVTPFELATAQPDLRGIYFIPSHANARANEVAIDQGALHEMFVRLVSLKTAFLSVLKAGGRTQTMDHIYCSGCNFAELGIDLSGVSFQGAILPRSQWSRLRLNRASFRNAVVEQANFAGAQLEAADFSNDEFNMNRQEYVSATALRTINPASRPALYLYEFSTGAPTFVCANLRDANFQNFPIVTRLDDESASKPTTKPLPKDPHPVTVTVVGQRLAWPMVFRGANISGADFREVREIVLRPINPKRTDPYVALHTVQTPLGYRYRYYADSVPLTYLTFYQPGKSAEQDRERDRNVEALALSFVETEHYDQAKLPPGVLEVIKAESAKIRFPFRGCAEYLNAGESAPPPAVRP